MHGKLQPPLQLFTMQQNRSASCKSIITTSIYYSRSAENNNMQNSSRLYQRRKRGYYNIHHNISKCNTNRATLHGQLFGWEIYRTKYPPQPPIISQPQHLQLALHATCTTQAPDAKYPLAGQYI